MTDRDLERLIDRELRALPDPAAPPTLLPRVMASVVAEGERPWYARAWFTWPGEIQVAAAVAALLLAGGVWMLAGLGPAWVAGLVSPDAGGGFSRVSSLAAWMGQAAVLGRVLWDVLLQPMVLYFAALAVAGALACAALWSAITSLALGGAAYR